jgi:hypothetical protein
LAFLLAAEFPGVEALRAQAATARVVGQCECGCATVDLDVDANAPRAEGVKQRNAVEAYGLARSNDRPPPGLILFVEEGRLASLEIVSNAEPVFSAFPPTGEFGPPTVLWLDADD